MTNSVRHPFWQITEKKDLPQILVAGGASFLGAALATKLLSQDISVVCLDNLATGKKENLGKLSSHPHFSFLEHDLTQPLPPGLSPDYIFHLAGLEEYLSGQDLTLETLLVNSLGTKNLLELSRKTGAKFLLASSLEVYSGLLSSTKIPDNFTEKGRALSHHEAKRYAEALVAEYASRFNLNCRIVRLLNIYGPKMNLAVGGEISQLLKEAKEEGTLKIKGDGLTVLYPTFIEDAVEGLTRAMFGQQTAGKIFTFVGSKTTILNFAYLLQEISPQPLKIVFVPGEEEFKFPLPGDFLKTAQELGWAAKTSPQAGLQKTLAWQLSGKEEKESPLQEKLASSPEVEIPKPPLTRPKFFPVKFVPLAILLSIFIFLLAFSAPFINLTWDVFWGAKNLQRASQLTAVSPQILEKEAGRAETHFRSAQKELDDLDWLFKITRQQEKEKTWHNFLFLAENLSSGGKHAAVAGQLLNQVLKVVLGQSDEEVEVKILETQTQLQIAEEKWALAEAELQGLPIQNLPGGKFLKMEKRLAEIKTKLPNFRQILGRSQKLTSVLPEITGLPGKRTYLLLLQNNMELRPTGGFIGSFGLLVFERGRLTDLKIEDIYTADGQLRGHVEPPAPIKKYLKEHWFLRDANFDPDFPKTAKQAEWFLEKELGIKVDGVLAFDLALAQNLLSSLGQVTLPDYQETITAENLFEKAEKYSEIDFFPGSTQKRDFLGALSRRILERLTTEKDLPWLSLVEAMGKSLTEKHFLLYFHHPGVQRLVEELGGGGEIKSPPTQDFLMINEANLGINKANFFVKRKVSYEVTIGKEAEIVGQVSIEYENKSPAETWPAGTYKNYLRIYAPLGATLEKMTIEGIVAESPKMATTSGEKAIFDLWVEVPILSRRQVAVSYRLPQKLPFDQGQGSYDLYLQKQPGWLADPLAVTINYPTYLKVAKTEPQVQVGEQSLTFTSDFSSDRQFRVEFTK